MKIEDFGPVTVILRGYEIDQVRSVCKVMNQSSIKNIEITTNSPNVFDTVSKMTTEFPDLNIGVGTVLNLDMAKKAGKAGAKFILAPIQLEKEVVEYCEKNNLLVVSAAFTPTEVMKAIECGADIVKIFPANSLAFHFAKDIKAPLGELKLMAVGGLNFDNVLEYQRGGYAYFGIGSGIFDKEDIVNRNEAGLLSSLKKFEERLNNNDR